MPPKQQKSAANKAKQGADKYSMDLRGRRSSSYDSLVSTRTQREDDDDYSASDTTIKEFEEVDRRPDLSGLLGATDKEDEVRAKPADFEDPRQLHERARKMGIDVQTLVMSEALAKLGKREPSQEEKWEKVCKSLTPMVEGEDIVNVI